MHLNPLAGQAYLRRHAPLMLLTATILSLEKVLCLLPAIMPSLPTLPVVVTRSKYQTIFSTHRLSSSSLTWWTDNWSGRLVFSLFPDIINNLRLYVEDLNGRVWAIWVWASPLWSGDETVKWRKGERNLKIHLRKGVPTLFCKILDLGLLSSLTGGRLLWRFVQLTKWNVLCAMAEDKAKPDVVFVLCFVFAAFTR